MAFITKRRKTQINEFVAFIVIVFSICLTIILSKYALVKIHEGFSSLDSDVVDAEAMTLINNSFNTFESDWAIFDGSIMFIIIGLTIGMIISAFLIPVHPVFLIVNIIGMIFLVFFGAILSNLYYEIAAAEGINETVYNSITGVNSFPSIDVVMHYLPFICAIVILIVTIVMYGKARNG